MHVEIRDAHLRDAARVAQLDELRYACCIAQMSVSDLDVHPKHPRRRSFGSSAQDRTRNNASSCQCPRMTPEPAPERRTMRPPPWLDDRPSLERPLGLTRR